MFGRCGGVEVLPDLGNYPISDGPGMNPIGQTAIITALNEDDDPEWGDGLRNELKLFEGRQRSRFLHSRGCKS